MMVDSQLIEHVCTEPIMRAELLRHFHREFLVEAPIHINHCKLLQLSLRLPVSSRFSSSMSACSVSSCELTETYSPTAIDIAPATSPATPATRIAPCEAEDAATPIMRLAVDTIASSDPSTAARERPVAAAVHFHLVTANC